MAGIAGQRLERYDILERIGRGGMAAVYRAYDRQDDRHVAIKVVAPHLSEDPNFQQRFRLEAEVLMNLRHPYIMPVEEYGEEEGYSYLVMPFLKVGTLTDRLMESRVGPRYGAKLVQQISEALQYLHDEGVVHRDVKPSNILLDEDGNILLSDFGLARLQESHASMTGSMMVGTPAFISPEQAKGEKADALSDQYSLGVILYLLTTGELPFDAETPFAVALMHISEPLPNLQTVSPNVPDAIARVILKATAKEPSDRFESVAKLNEAFQAAIAHVLDPKANPDPEVQLPGSVGETIATPLPVDPAKRSNLRLALAGAGAVMALALAFPVLAAYGRPTEGEGASLAPQVQASESAVALEATMSAMATELAGSREELMQAEQVQTAVVLTLQAAEAYPTETPKVGPIEEIITTFLTPEALFIPAATNTQRPTSTGSAFSLPQPTATPIATMSEPSPTASPITPTSEASPIPPTPTSSPIPPTSTQAPDPCSLLESTNFSAAGNEVSWELSNHGGEGVLITRVVLDWPSSNSSLKKVRLDGSQIWNSGDDEPDSDIQSGWKGNLDWRVLDPGPPQTLSFEFSSTAASSGYGLEVEFNNGCDISG